MSALRKVTLTYGYKDDGRGKALALPRLLLDDEDISYQTRACTIHVNAHGDAEVTVELATYQAEFDGDAIVKVGDETAALLTSLGWTAP